ncbi:MAG TPA: 6-phosphofructokinase, partial [Candidatus Methylomirabilis sp.]
VYDRFGRCVVGASEGIRDADGNPILTQLVDRIEKDAHGNIQLSGTGALGDLLAESVKKNLNIKRVRSDTFGYLQRSFFGCVSDVDQQEAREVGEKAAQVALLHDLEGSVTIQRTGSYAVDYQLASLAEIAGKTRTMPDEFINDEGNDVTDTFLFYVRPLLGSGLQSPHRLRAPRVAKILKKEE